MLKPRIDLHCHTIDSDGGDSVGQIIEKSRAAALDFVAITDHDYCRPENTKELSSAGILTCEAVEVSARDLTAQHSLHILCYAEKISAEIHALLDPIRENRGGWEAKIAAMKKYGFIGSYPELLAWKKDKNLGIAATGTRHVRTYFWENPHNQNLARQLIREENIRRKNNNEMPLSEELSTVPDSKAFSRLFLKPSSPILKKEMSLPEPKVDLERLARLAKKSQALLSVAHPNFSFIFEGDQQEWASRVNRYLDWGIQGVEINPFASQEWVEEIYRQAQEKNLIVTFGSDCHGPKDQTHGALGETHPFAESNVPWYKQNFRRFLEKINTAI